MRYYLMSTDVDASRAVRAVAATVAETDPATAARLAIRAAQDAVGVLCAWGPDGAADAADAALAAAAAALEAADAAALNGARAALRVARADFCAHIDAIWETIDDLEDRAAALSLSDLGQAHQLDQAAAQLGPAMRAVSGACAVAAEAAIAASVSPAAHPNDAIEFRAATERAADAVWCALHDAAGIIGITGLLDAFDAVCDEHTAVTARIAAGLAGDWQGTPGELAEAAWALA